MAEVGVIVRPSLLSAPQPSGNSLGLLRGPRLTTFSRRCHFYHTLAELGRWLQQRLCGLQSLKSVLSSPLQKKFADLALECLNICVLSIILITRYGFFEKRMESR